MSIEVWIMVALGAAGISAVMLAQTRDERRWARQRKAEEAAGGRPTE